MGYGFGAKGRAFLLITGVVAAAWLGVVVPAACAPAAGTLVTIAGTEASGFSGDGGPAVVALLSSPGGIAVDALGNIFVGDTANGRVRKITAYGVISTVAGGAPRPVGAASNGDGGPATQAYLDGLGGIALDARGDLFITEFDAGRVRKVSPDGIITTVAGGGKKVGASAEGGPATEALLHFAIDVKADSAGDLFIAGGPSNPDGGGDHVWKVGPDGILTTVAGTGKAGSSGDGGPATKATLDAVAGLALDGAGNLYISQFGSDLAEARVRKVGPDGMITTVAGMGTEGFSGDGGLATGARLNHPWGLAVDASGAVFIADNGNRRVRRVGPDGVITTVAGGGKLPARTAEGGPAVEAALAVPGEIALDSAGNLFITEGPFGPDGAACCSTAPSRVLKVVSAAAPGTLAGRPFPPGDVDSDGAITIGDAVLALRIAVGELIPTDAQKKSADVNGDGAVNMADAFIVLRRAIGL